MDSAWNRLCLLSNAFEEKFALHPSILKRVTKAATCCSTGDKAATQDPSTEYAENEENAVATQDPYMTIPRKTKTNKRKRKEPAKEPRKTKTKKKKKRRSSGESGKTGPC